jgi:phenylalanyl-tRNA synthetase beta chain
MRAPLAWLADYVDVELSPEQLADRLTRLGMEVKGIDRWGADWQNVVVGELLTVDKHPNADRLSLTTVTIGDGEPLSIVCGATNIAPGQRVPVALPGAVLPGNRRIERTEKMGVVSNGMLCSGDELHLTSDADGILILPPDAPIGRPLVDLYGDTVLDVDVKPNRGDALSLVGLAREVSALTGAAVRFPSVELVEDGPPASERVVVDVREPELCPRFVARVLSGVRVGPSPDVVQMRLQAAGMRPISNVVDASNYVMLELGKPTHAYDAARLRDAGSGPRRIIVRRAAPGETLETLDHVRRELDPETLVIADPSGVIGIAGVMGGADTEVGEQTRDVVVESAIFDPVSIRRTGHRYALRSEASLRFEKGQEFRLARIGADRVAALIAAWAGGSIASGVVDTAPTEPEPGHVAFRPNRVNRLLGTDLAAEEQVALLDRVGIVAAASPAPGATPIVVARGAKPLDVAPGPDPVLVARVPSWRRDLVIEADIAEEIARVGGYEEIAATLPDTAPPAYRADPLEARDAVRDVLAGAGVREVVTYALVAPDVAPRLRWPGDAGPPADGEAAAAGDPITVTNPLSANHSVLRQQLVSSLVGVVDQNVRQGRDDVAIFEVGKGYGRTAEGPHEWWRLAIALVGAAEPAAWNRTRREYDLDDAKGLVELLAAELGHEAVTFAADTRGYPFHPGRTAVARAGEGLVGYVAELHPEAIETFDVRVPRLIVAELSIAGLSGGQLAPVRSRPVPRHPAVDRDVAIVVAADRPAAEVADRIRSAGGDLLSEVRLFDIYRGAPLDATEKSLAYRLTFQADRTLTEAEVDGAMAAVTSALAAAGGRLRA